MPKYSLSRRARKYRAIFRVSLQNAFTYRGNVVGRMALYTLFIFVFFNLWRAITHGGEVAGYTLPQMVWYLCITELIVFGCRSPFLSQMNDDIKSGAIAYQLGRPYHYVFYQFAQALGGNVFSLVSYGAVAIILGLVMVGPLPGFSLLQLPFALLSLLLGVVINFFFLMCIGMSAFKIEDNTALNLIYHKLVFMLGMFIPIEMLPGWAQNAARLLPFPYIAWAPAKLFVSFSWELFSQVVPLQFLWAVVSILLTLAIYHAGAKGIEAHGG